MEKTSNTPPPTTKQLLLPHRFREPSFRFYEPTIAAVLKAYPGHITINCSNYLRSPETFCCRFRDAMRSYLEHNWTSKFIDRQQFLSIHSQIRVSPLTATHFVRIGTVTSIRGENSTAVDALTQANNRTCHPTSTKVFNLTDLSLSTAQLLCQLAAERVLTQPIYVLGLTSDDILTLQQTYDVSIELDQQTGIASVL